MSNPKYFAERLNQCLDDMGAPTNMRERAAVLSKLVDISKQQAWSLVEGHAVPNEDIIKRMAEEFEVDPEWLAGD